MKRLHVFAVLLLLTGNALGVPPAAPSDLTATAVNPTRVNLKWKDNAGNEEGFIIGRSTNGTNFAPLPINPPANATSFADRTVVAGTTYWYRVRSFVGDDNSAFSNTESVTTPGGAATPTPTPTPTPTATATPTPTATATPTATGTPTPEPTASPTATATPTPTPTPTATPSATASPSPTATPTPRLASATVSWDAAARASGYVVVWGTASGKYSKERGLGDDVSCRLENELVPGTKYYFAVKAYNSYALSPISEEVSYTPQP